MSMHVYHYIGPYLLVRGANRNDVDELLQGDEIAEALWSPYLPRVDGIVVMANTLEMGVTLDEYNTVDGVLPMPDFAADSISLLSAYDYQIDILKQVGTVTVEYGIVTYYL